MAQPRIRLALTNARFVLFLAMGTERLPKETSTPKYLACLVEEIPKLLSCQPERTVRALPRVVATNPHFEGDRSTLSFPREWSSSTAGWLNLYKTSLVVPSVYVLRSSRN